MPLLRFFMLLSLVLWLGGIIFFGAVVAPTVFAVLPTHELAGRVVSRSLAALHWIGIISGVVFALTSMVYSRLTSGSAQPFATGHLLIFAMIALTLVSQFALSAKMNSLRAQMGVIDQAAPTDALRVQFNSLHQWSTRLESGVLVLGFVVLYITARRFH